MANDNNRPPISKVNYFDGMVPTNLDMQTAQDASIQYTTYAVQDFAGSGVLNKAPVSLPPILNTSKPNPANISFSTLGAGNFDGLGIFMDRQPIDNVHGDQLLVTLTNVKIPLYSPTKVVIFGKVYDPTMIQGRPILETLTFDQPGAKATLNYFKSVVAVFFNNFAGAIGRTSASPAAQTSLNTSIPGLVGQVVITEVGSLQVLDYGVVLHQTNIPNLDVRDFITSTIARTFQDELNFVVSTAQNTGYVAVSPTDLALLPLNTTGLAIKPFLDSTTNGVLYGQKIFLTTNNIQQFSFALSLADDAYGWSGELVIGVRPLQTTSTNQFAAPIDLDPDVNVLFEASFTQTELLGAGYVLTSTPQEIKFNFIGTAVAQPNGILTANQYYVVTLSRRADISVGKIYIDVGSKELTNSMFTSFNPTTKAWTDDAQTDLWFKIYSAAVRVSSGIAYSTSGTMLTLQKTTTADDGSIISFIAGPYSLAVIDSIGSDNIVILQATEAFNTPDENPRTGNLVYVRSTEQVAISILDSAEFTALLASTATSNGVYPIVLAVINDLNNKTNISFVGAITLPGQVRSNEIVLFNTGIADRLLEVNNVIIPNNASVGIRYRIVAATSTKQYLGDFNNDKIFTSSDLVRQAIIQDTFSAQSTNTFTNTSFDPYSIFDPRSRDALGFDKETVEDFILADVDGYLTINSADTARLQYLTTTLPVFVTPSPTSTTIQVLEVENITSANTPILVAEITNLDGYANATSPDKVAFTALNVGDMRALSLGDLVDLSADGYTGANGQYTSPAYTNLVVKDFVQRNDLLIETRFGSNVLPTLDTSYFLTFYNQNPVFGGKLGVFGEVATEVLEFVAPGIPNLNTAGVLAGDIVKITGDSLVPNRNGEYTISQVLNASTFRVSAPLSPITGGIGNAGVEIFAGDGKTDKVANTDVIQFTLNSVNLITSNIQEGDIVHITLGPVALNGTYTVARVINATTFTIVPPSPTTAQTFNATFEFRAAGDVIVKIPPTSITGAVLGVGPTPYIITGLETLAPASLPDGIDTIFDYSLTHFPITGTVLVHWVSGGINKTMTFGAAPIQVTGDGNPDNSSINRLTGTITIDTFTAPDASTVITTDYRIAPTVTLKHCYPSVINAISPLQTDIEFRVPFINPISNTDIQGVAGAPYVIVQKNNADPPTVVLDGSGNVVAGAVQVNTINPISDVTLPSRNVVFQLTDSAGNVPNIASGAYWMQVYSGKRVNLPAVQKEFLSDTLSLSSPLTWTIQKNNFEWLESDMMITDCRRFLPAAFVSNIKTTYNSINEMWVPSDLYVGRGEILSAPGVPYHGDIEINKINLPLPVTALLSNNINIYNTLIASWAETPGITRAGRPAMKFSDGSYVGADDVGLDTALTKGQVRIMPSFSSIYLDGYKVPNASTYVDLDEVLTKLHYEIRSGMSFDDNTGMLFFHIENIKAIFDNEPIVQTGIFRIVLDVSLKKSGFANAVVDLDVADVLRLFTIPVNIIATPKYSISGEIVSGFTVGRSTNPDG